MSQAEMMFDTKFTLIYQLRPRETFLDPDPIPSTKTSLLRRLQHTIKCTIIRKLLKKNRKQQQPSSSKSPASSQKTMERAQRSTPRNRPRRATYPGSTGRQFGQGRLASAMESHRFLYAMRIDQPPLIYRDESQPGGDANPTDLHDILPPFASMLRD